MDDLDDLFANAKSEAMQPSDALMARILGDAAREQPRPKQQAIRANPSSGLWSALVGLFGGGGVLAGIGSAAVAGLFLGVVQPAALTTLTDNWASDTGSLELMPGIDALLTEE